MNPVYHANSNVKKYGGKVEDYLPIHNWFDHPKSTVANARHRILRHHAYGIFECEQKFGEYIINSDGRKVPVRMIGEDHVREDCGGRIPSVQDWVENLHTKPWMNRGYSVHEERMLTSRDDKTYESVPLPVPIVP